ncbi:trans-sulfuration enzyme family protein [Hydrocarboniclastica marina]|uniref:Cystathionine gamma-synthase n=1 Tax=Hydrocarboniclastica marina TaxID=2259620 RepID=A0A4P7XEK5_9ALTE|nr:aminotransferase class I/II-fold pyridoxal phosphate-dependent enzyme [Hydrocarboniclastica marina]QCF25369.1 cystathionine gamma-synthase [Hydrocarboniclastica marina]
MSDRPHGPSPTTLIHNNKYRDAHGSPYTPVYTTTTWRFDSTADLLDVVEGRKPGCLYTRYGTNPTIRELEHSLAQLEVAPAALAFASGMAAISATLLAHGRYGIVCVGELYGGTQEFLHSHCRELGIPVNSLMPQELDQLGPVLDRPGMLVYCETPANPTLSILDIRHLAEIAHQHGARLAVDNTFASPINQRPLQLGADLVLHSASKYLGGHSDITAGALMGSEELVGTVARWRKNLGQVLSPETAALLSRSLRTLPLRIHQHNHNAQAVAEAMATHPRVSRVLYPGLSGFPGHELAAQQMDGFGGMLSIEVDGDRDAASRVADNLRVFVLAPSLGGTESLVGQPCTTSHHDLTPEERQRLGIGDNLLRLSVGLEDAGDLIDDLKQALDKI